MADWNDPLSVALQGRAATPTQPSQFTTPYSDAVAEQQAAAPVGGAMGGGMAMAAPGAPAAGPASYDNTPAFYAYDPETKALIVNAAALPHDITAWEQAVTAAPDQLVPMDIGALARRGYVPMTAEQAQAMVQSIKANATAPVLSNLATSAASGARSVVAGALDTAAALSDRSSPVGQFAENWIPGVSTMHSAADMVDASGDRQRGAINAARGTAESIKRNNQQAQLDQRAGLTLEEQAGQDAGFTEHPLTYLANTASNAGALAAPLAALAANPVAGALAFGAQVGDTVRQQTEDTVRAHLEHASPEQLMQDPTYVQLRQTMSDAEARDVMIRNAGDIAGTTAFGAGAATTPLYGRGVAALMGKGTLNGFIPKALAARAGDGAARSLARFAGRGVLTGGEGTALNLASTIPARMVGERYAGAGTGNPLDYVNGEEVANSMWMIGGLGAFARHSPVEVARNSDIGAAGAARPALPPPDQRPVFGPGLETLPGFEPVQRPVPEALPQAPNWQTAPGVDAPARPTPEAIPQAPNWQTAPGVDAPRPTAPPAPAAPDFTTSPGVARLGGPLALRRRAQMEAEAARDPNVVAGELPPPGPTQGQLGARESAQASLDMVNNLLKNGSLNKRTKSGKAAIAQLMAERDRLQRQLTETDNAIAGEEIGGVREARQAQGIEPPPSRIMDPATGQRELDLGPGTEPSGDPRLTGAREPLGAGPDTSIEPPPISNPVPMSVAEARARMRAQAERDANNPQGDLLGGPAGELRNRLAHALRDEAPVPRTTPEPAADLQAQADALGKTRDTLFVAAGNESAMPKVRRGVRKVVRDEGTLFTTDKAKADAFRKAPQVTDDMLAGLQDLPETKAAALRSGQPEVVAAEDAAGNVVKEAVSSPGGPNEAAVAAARPAGGTVVRRSALAAQARRQAKAAEEAPKPTRAQQLREKATAKKAAPAKRSRLDTIKDAAAEKAAKGKKKVPVPVTAEEVAGKAGPEPKAAAKRLEQDLTENHPDSAPRDGRSAEGALAKEPLTDREYTEVVDRAHATARAEAAQIEAGTWAAAKSQVAKFLTAVGVALPREKLAQAVKQLAALTPDGFHATLRPHALKLAQSTFAKQVARGFKAVSEAVPHSAMADKDVAHMIRTGDAPAGTMTSDPPALHAKKGPVAVMSKSIPKEAADAVAHWLNLAGTHGEGILSGKQDVTIVSMKQAHAMRPADVDPSALGVSFAATDSTGGRHVIVGVDWPAFRGNEAAALETLAHETGHAVGEAVFAQSSKEVQAKVRAAFEDWLNASNRLTPSEQMISRAPPALAEMFRKQKGNIEREYAASFREWVADEVAKFYLTNAKPRTVVERFFAKVADALKSIYAKIDGRGRPSEAVREMMENFADYSRALKENDAAARAMDRNYGREPAAPIKAVEVQLAHMHARATASRTERTIERAKGLREDLRAMTGSAADMRRAANNAIAALDHTAAGDFVRKLARNVMTMEDLVGAVGKKTTFGKALFDWDHWSRVASTTSHAAQQPGAIALERANRLSAPVRTALNQLMYKSTVYGIHPDVAFGVGKNAHLKSSDPATEASNRARWGEVFTLWNQLKGVDGDPHAVFAGLRDAMHTMREQYFEKQRELIDDLPIEDKFKDEMFKRLEADHARQTQGPYFPLVREGNYITTALMPQQRVGEYKTKAEANIAADREKAANPHAKVTTTFVPEDGVWEVHAGENAVYFHHTIADALKAKPQIEAEMAEAWKHLGVDIKDFDGAVVAPPMSKVDFFRKAEVPQTGSFMARINEMYTAKEIDPEVYQQLVNMYIDAMPEGSPRKGALTRENVRGADMNMIRGYGRRLAGAAHTYGQLSVAKERNKAWATMYKNRGENPRYGAVMQDVYNRQQVIAKRHESNGINTFANTVQDASSFMSLAFSPAFALQQMAQPIVVSLPVLAARARADGAAVGYGTAMKYMKEAYEGMGGFFGKRAKDQFLHELKRVMGKYGGEGKTLQESAVELLETFAKNSDERDMLNDLNARGLLDFAFLNAFNEGASLSAAGAKAKAVSRLSMAIPQQLEAMNRTLTGLVAYRLARAERGMEHGEAVQEARAVVSQTHGDYSRYNRPSVFNRPLLGMALQFKMYTQMMYSLGVRNFIHMLDPRMDKAQRMQAARTLGYVIASHAAVGGAVGIGPLAGAAKLAVGGLMYAMAGAGMIDKKKKDQTLEDWIAQETEALGDEMFGKGRGRTLRKVGTYGLPALIDANVSGRLGLPDLLDTRFTGKPLGEQATTGDWMDRAVITALGSPYSNAKRLANGTQLLLKGDMGGAAKQLLPAAPRALLAAATEAQRGVVTASGEVIRPPEEMSPYETFLRALGIQDAETSLRYEDRSANYEARDRIRSERSELLQAYREGDAAEREKVRRQIEEFNRGRDKVLQISSGTLRRQDKPFKTSKELKAIQSATGRQ